MMQWFVQMKKGVLPIGSGTRLFVRVAERQSSTTVPFGTTVMPSGVPA